MGRDLLRRDELQTLLDMIDRTEGAGNYSTLFGHAQRPGQPFAWVDVFRMNLDQLATFAPLR